MMYFYSNKGKAIAALLLVLALCLMLAIGLHLGGKYKTIPSTYDTLIHAMLEFDLDAVTQDFDTFTQQYPGLLNSEKEYWSLLSIVKNGSGNQTHFLALCVNRTGSMYIVEFGENQDGIFIQNAIPIPADMQLTLEEVAEKLEFQHAK